VTAPGEGWAVGSTLGEPPRGRIWQLAGGSWSPYAFDPSVVLTHLVAVASDDVWAAGNGVARWNGDAWKLVEGAPHYAMSGPLVLMEGGQAPRGWFGSTGHVIGLADGEWTTEELPSDESLIDLAAWPPKSDGSVEVYGASARDLFARRAGTWSTLGTPLRDREEIVSLSAPRPEDAWLLTDQSRLLYWRDEVRGWHVHDLALLGRQARMVNVDAEPQDNGGWVMTLTGGHPSIARYQIEVPASRAFLPLTARGALP
jgi:hypothetical protein